MRAVLAGVSLAMSDPRNIAHDKKVSQEKHHEGEKPHGRKEHQPAAAPPEVHEPGEHEKSVAVLSKLKEMEFHSRANIESLAQLTLTIEDELKQKEFSKAIGDIYATQDKFQTTLGELIQAYEAKVESLKPAP